MAQHIFYIHRSKDKYILIHLNRLNHFHFLIHLIHLNLIPKQLQIIILPILIQFRSLEFLILNLHQQQELNPIRIQILIMKILIELFQFILKLARNFKLKLLLFIIELLQFILQLVRILVIQFLIFIPFSLEYISLLVLIFYIHQNSFILGILIEHYPNRNFFFIPIIFIGLFCVLH